MLQEEVIFVLILLGIVITAHVVVALTFTFLAKQFYKPKTEKGKRSLLKFSQSLKWGLFFVIWPIVEPFVSPEHFTYIRSHPLFVILFIVNLSWILIELSNVLRYYFIDHFSIDKEDNLRERSLFTQITFIRKLVVIIILIISFSVILMNIESVRRFGTGLLTSAGVLGIIIGFAAQKSIANLLAGFQIAFTQPIRIDDVVVVEGEWGKIEEINLTYVVVRIWDQRRLVLPINYFIEKPFQNWTKTTADIWGTVFLYVDHTIPVSDLKRKLAELLKASPLWDGKVQVLQVTDVKESTIELRCLMSAKDSPTAFDLRCMVREEMILYIQEKYPHTLPKTRVLFENKPFEGDHSSAPEVGS